MKEAEKEGKERRRERKGRKESVPRPPDAEFHHSIDGILSCDL